MGRTVRTKKKIGSDVPKQQESEKKTTLNNIKRIQKDQPRWLIVLFLKSILK